MLLKPFEEREYQILKIWIELYSNRDALLVLRNLITHRSTPNAWPSRLTSIDLSENAIKAVGNGFYDDVLNSVTTLSMSKNQITEISVSFR